MPYVGKKATNVVDVAESQSLTIDDNLTTVLTAVRLVDGATLRITANENFSTWNPNRLRQEVPTRLAIGLR